jgi:hypothetical protein
MRQTFAANRSGNGDERSDGNGKATETPETHFIGTTKKARFYPGRTDSNKNT